MRNINKISPGNCIGLSVFLVYIAFISLAFGATETKVTKIAHPGLVLFPNDDDLVNLTSRTVWDLQYHDGRIYIGIGNYWQNMGPIDVWSFDSETFRKECTVDEEQIQIFREYGGRLYIPGMDGTEPWEYGNLYIRNGQWQKLRTIPVAAHVYDVAVLGDIYISLSSSISRAILKSSDMGQTWEKVIDTNESKSSFIEMVALGNSLVIMGRNSEGQECVYKYSDGNTEKLVIPPPQDMVRSMPHNKMVAFGDGVLYNVNCASHYAGKPAPLMFLNDFINGPVIIEKFQNMHVRDIIIRHNTCYVLAILYLKDDFRGAIYSSSDLDNWKEIAEFSVPAEPRSLELLDGVFYIGLGGRYIDSGSIYRLDLNVSQTIPAWDIDRNGFVGIADFIILAQYFGEELTSPLETNPDVNSDGKVNILDIITLARHLGEIY